MIVVSQKKKRYYLEKLGWKNNKIYLSFLNRRICVGTYRSSLRAAQILSDLYDASVSGETEFYMPKE